MKFLSRARVLSHVMCAQDRLFTSKKPNNKIGRLEEGCVLKALPGCALSAAVLSKMPVSVSSVLQPVRA